jgi:hypothetical protein
MTEIITFEHSTQSKLLNIKESRDKKLRLIYIYRDRRHASGLNKLTTD